MRGQDHKTDAEAHFSTEKESKMGPGDGPGTVKYKNDLMTGFQYYSRRSAESDEFLSTMQKWLLLFGLAGNIFLIYFMQWKRQRGRDVQVRQLEEAALKVYIDR